VLATAKSEEEYGPIRLLYIDRLLFVLRIFSVPF
jgi:hypothetical protein